MDFLEKDLEEIIFNATDKELWSRNLFVYGKKYRQLSIGTYGVADLVFVSRTPYELIINIVELKKDKIGISAFLQALGYAKGIKRYLDFRNFSFDYIIKITLIGRSLDKNSTFSFLPDMLNHFNNDVDEQFLENYTYEYGLSGIMFYKHENYSNVEETWRR